MLTKRVRRWWVFAFTIAWLVMIFQPAILVRSQTPTFNVTYFQIDSSQPGAIGTGPSTVSYNSLFHVDMSGSYNYHGGSPTIYGSVIVFDQCMLVQIVPAAYSFPDDGSHYFGWWGAGGCGGSPTGIGDTSNHATLPTNWASGIYTNFIYFGSTIATSLTIYTYVPPGYHTPTPSVTPSPTLAANSLFGTYSIRPACTPTPTAGPSPTATPEPGFVSTSSWWATNWHTSTPAPSSTLDPSQIAPTNSPFSTATPGPSAIPTNTGVPSATRASGDCNLGYWSSHGITDNAPIADIGSVCVVDNTGGCKQDCYVLFPGLDITLPSVVKDAINTAWGTTVIASVGPSLSLSMLRVCVQYQTLSLFLFGFDFTGLLGMIILFTGMMWMVSVLRSEL